MTLRELLKTVSISSDEILDIVVYDDDDEDFYHTFGFWGGCFLNKVIHDPKAPNYPDEEDMKYFDCEVRDIQVTRLDREAMLKIEVNLRNRKETPWWLKEMEN